MGFRKYIIRNRDEEAWLVNIFIDKGIKTYRYMPDAGMAIKYETKTEADKVAAACRGQVQILKMDRSGNYYAGDSNGREKQEATRSKNHRRDIRRDEEL